MDWARVGIEARHSRTQRPAASSDFRIIRKSPFRS
jgi:hypothetical protein